MVLMLTRSGTLLPGGTSWTVYYCRASPGHEVGQPGVPVSKDEELIDR
jgi:hypothetical protein